MIMRMLSTFTTNAFSLIKIAVGYGMGAYKQHVQPSGSVMQCVDTIVGHLQLIDASQSSHCGRVLQVTRHTHQRVYYSQIPVRDI